MDEKLINDIITSNELLRVQIWILGGVLSALLLLITFFAKEAWNDARSMIDNHTQRITILEKNDAIKEQAIEHMEYAIFKSKR